VVAEFFIPALLIGKYDSEEVLPFTDVEEEEVDVMYDE
jgi:hypothetical protein